MTRRRALWLAMLVVVLVGGGAFAWWWLADDPGAAADLVRRVLPPAQTRREAIRERHPEAMAFAAAVLEPVGSSRVRGTVTFADLGEGRGVRIDVELRGLAPGLHGLHVHEGPCGDPSASDWDPEGGRRHGAPQVAASHAGDFGNVVADDAGRTRVTLHSSRFAVGAGPAGIVGRSISLHEGPDDMVTQPHGSAGPVVSCGPIKSR